MRARSVGIAGIGVLCVLGIVYLRSKGWPNRLPEEDASTPIASSTTAERAYRVTSSSSLVRAYEANEVAADQEWKHVDVELTGTVDEIAKSALGNITIVVGGVHVHLKRNQETNASLLEKGTRRTFRGRVVGKLLGFVVVSDGELVP